MRTTTKQFRKRNAIYKCLCSSDKHPSAEMVHEMLRQECPDISLATVYRNLTYFKNQGLAVSVATVRGVERFDANTQPHVHFICRQCDAVIDLHQIPVPCFPAEQCGGCQVDSCALTLTGLCMDCQNSQ